MRTLILGFLIAALFLLGGAGLMHTRAEAGCYQFSTWEAAQAAHLSAPYLGLDADGNGIACDCLLNGFPC